MQVDCDLLAAQVNKQENNEMVSAIDNINSLSFAPAVGLAGKAAITAFVTAILANLPKTLASSCQPEAYKNCLANCLKVFPGMDQGYDACARVCEAKFLNPWAGHRKLE